MDPLSQWAIRLPAEMIAARVRVPPPSIPRTAFIVGLFLPCLSVVGQFEQDLLESSNYCIRLEEPLIIP